MTTQKILALVALVFCFACTKQKVIDTGTSKAQFDGTVMQYLRADDYNWKLTVQMIERAGITDLFEGRVDSVKALTFLAPTHYSILRYMLDHNVDTITRLTPEFCRETILKHVVKGKILKKDIPFRNKQYYIYDPAQPASGYKTMPTLGGRNIRAYLETTPYGLSPEGGPIVMFLYSMSQGLVVPLASPDIQPTNGVVHALNYNYLLNNL